MKKLVSVMFCVVLLGVLSSCSAARTPGEFDELAQCMTDNGFTMYGTDTCPYCKAQKSAFKGSFDLIEYVECTRDPAKCQEAGIEGYPTWIADGKKYTGKKGLNELAELSGCEIKPKAEEKVEFGAS